MGQRHSEADEAMREYGLREPEFRDMEIGFRINLYRNTEDALEDTTQGKHRNIVKRIGNSQKGYTLLRSERSNSIIKPVSDLTL